MPYLGKIAHFSTFRLSPSWTFRPIFKANLKGGVFLSKDNDEEQSSNDHVKYIFTPFITLKNGRKIYAVSYGKKAFRIPVKL